MLDLKQSLRQDYAWLLMTGSRSKQHHSVPGQPELWHMIFVVLALYRSVLLVLKYVHRFSVRMLELTMERMYMYHHGLESTENLECQHAVGISGTLGFPLFHFQYLAWDPSHISALLIIMVFDAWPLGSTLVWFQPNIFPKCTNLWCRYTIPSSHTVGPHWDA